MQEVRTKKSRKKRVLGTGLSETFILWPEHMQILEAWAKHYGFVDAAGHLKPRRRSRTLRLLLLRSRELLSRSGQQKSHGPPRPRHAQPENPPPPTVTE